MESPTGAHFFGMLTAFNVHWQFSSDYSHCLIACSSEWMARDLLELHSREFHGIELVWLFSWKQLSKVA